MIIRLICMFSLLFLFVLGLNSYTVSPKKESKEVLLSFKNVSCNKIASKSIPKDYLLAMIAIHECINLQPQDTKYIIEASYNRELINWGKYGDIYDQILTSEFKGLIDSKFYFDPKNKKHLYALECARRVLNGEKEIHNRFIVGWLTNYDNDSVHIKRASKRVIPTPTWHKFWTTK